MNPRFEAFLRDSVPGLQGPMRLRPIAGGQSNPTFFVDFDNRSMVLRKQPDANLLPSAHAVDREYRVMKALAATDLPVPAMILFHAERDLLGTPFYLMEKLDGRVFAPYALPGMEPAERRAIYLAMAQAMAKLHQVDWAGIGLADYGKPGSYFSRQVARWTRQWQMSGNAPNADIERLVEWLPANIPDESATTLCHGDFRLGNLMFHPTEPRVIAVLDWELSTLGHPLADVAYNCIAYHTLPAEYGGIRGLDLAALGIPSQAKYLEHYHRLSGRAERCTAFHFAFALFRMAVIFEGIVARARSGNAVADNAADVGKLGAVFAARAIEFVDGPAAASVTRQEG